jgi:hypothetical protein
MASSTGTINDIRVDWFMRFKIERNFFLLPFISQDRADKQHETIGWHTIVQFQALLSTGYGCQYRQRLTRDLIFEAVPYSCVNMAEARDI